MTQEDSSLTLEQLAEKIAAHYVAILNDPARPLDTILEEAEKLHSSGKIDEEAHDLVTRGMGIIRGALKQMARLNQRSGDYAPLDSKKAENLLKEPIRSRRRYPFHMGTVDYVVDTYAGELKASLDYLRSKFRSQTDPDPNGNFEIYETRAMTAAIENLYLGLHPMMDDAQAFFKQMSPENKRSINLPHSPGN